MFVIKEGFREPDLLFTPASSEYNLPLACTSEENSGRGNIDVVLSV